MQEKVKAVNDFPQLQTARQLRRFMELVIFYHHFIPHCAELMQPLHSLLKGKSQKITWTDAATTSFLATKAALANASLQPPTLDFVAIAATQATDPLIRSLQSSPNLSLVVEPIPLPDSPHPLYCDTSTGTQRPIVPQSWRRTVFHSLHNLSHPGI